jgi:hypothetical protein
MSGPAPAEHRQRTNEPARGDWQAAPGVGWQHGDIPPCPARGEAAAETWRGWFTDWYASHWRPGDLPNLRLIIKLWARADSGKATGAERSELRQLMDSYGITPKGQADRRWKPPATTAAQNGRAPVRASRATSPAAHLSVVPDDER